MLLRSKPTGFHSAFVISVVLSIVCAVCWLAERQRRVADRANLQMLREDHALAEKRIQALEAANDGAKVTLIAIEKMLGLTIDDPGESIGLDEQRDVADGFALH